MAAGQADSRGWLLVIASSLNPPLAAAANTTAHECCQLKPIKPMLSKLQINRGRITGGLWTRVFSRDSYEYLTWLRSVVIGLVMRAEVVKWRAPARNVCSIIIFTQRTGRDLWFRQRMVLGLRSSQSFCYVANCNFDTGFRACDDFRNPKRGAIFVHPNLLNCSRVNTFHCSLSTNTPTKLILPDIRPVSQDQLWPSFQLNSQFWRNTLYLYQDI